jgi:hypothetical protein
MNITPLGPICYPQCYPQIEPRHNDPLGLNVGSLINISQLIPHIPHKCNRITDKLIS